MSTNISILPTGDPKYIQLLQSFAARIRQHRDSELARMYNQMVDVMDELEAYISQLELDNYQLSLEKERCDNLEVVVRMYRFGRHHNANPFMNAANIQSLYSQSPEMYRKVQKAMNYCFNRQQKAVADKNTPKGVDTSKRYDKEHRRAKRMAGWRKLGFDMEEYYSAIRNAKELIEKHKNEN